MKRTVLATLALCFALITFGQTKKATTITFSSQMNFKTMFDFLHDEGVEAKATDPANRFSRNNTLYPVTLYSWTVSKKDILVGASGVSPHKGRYIVISGAEMPGASGDTEPGDTSITSFLVYSDGKFEATDEDRELTVFEITRARQYLAFLEQHVAARKK